MSPRRRKMEKNDLKRIRKETEMNMKRMAIVAIVGLAALCEIGIGCSKNATDADANLEADAAVDAVAAAYEAKMYDSALSQLNDAHLDGNARAMMYRALMYLEGNGLPQDRKMSRRLLERSVKAGYDLSGIVLAALSGNDGIIGKSEEKAEKNRIVLSVRECLLRISERGHVRLRGNYEFKMFEEILTLMMKTSPQTIGAVAPKLLGDIYAKGIVGVPPDMEKAGAMYCNAAAISRKNGEWKDECRYLEKAIKYGSIEARARLGIRLLQGKGVAKNTDRAKTLICPEDDDAPGAAYALWAEIVCRGLDKRKWIISDADDALNAYMEAAAFLNGKKVHIISTAKDLNEDCQDELSQLIKAEKVGGKRCSDLVAVLKKDGILPFIQDWFAADPDLGSKVLMIGVPDFWIVGGYVPVPSNLAFVGMRSKTRIVPEGWTGEGENEKLQKIWARLNKRVDVGKKLPKNEILRRRWVRQRFGMIANNAAFLLAEAGRDADALDICGAIVELIDPDNVSAIFNAFEIVRRMKNPNAEVKQAVEKKLKQIGDDPKKRHQRWTLSRSYGYVYNAEIFAKMGYAWAKSGAFDMAKGAKGASGLKMKK